MHRHEARVAAVLPGSVPAPRLRAAFDDGEWIGMAFAAHAGFCLAAALRPASARRRPVLDYKRLLGLSALSWLATRTGAG